MKIERLEGQFQEAGRDIEDLDVLGEEVHRANLKKILIPDLGLG